MSLIKHNNHDHSAVLIFDIIIADFSVLSRALPLLSGSNITNPKVFFSQIQKYFLDKSKSVLCTVLGDKYDIYALKKASDYYEAVVNEDISRIDGIEKRPDRVRSLMRSLSRNISSEAGTVTILKDLLTNDESLSQVTIDQYTNALKRLFVIDDLPAWSPKLRSKTALRTTAKRHFSDPSIATAALGATVPRLFDDFCTFGLLFESLCIRDLRVYADSIDGSVYHYRDARGVEVDAIIQMNDGRWGAVEIKMGAGYIEAAAENLLNFKANIDTTRMSEPSFLMVLTATETAFQMENGVWVVPLGCLKN